MECIKEKKIGADGKEKITRKWQITRKEVDGVPIVEKYKYLGTFLDFKLTEENQINFIKKKADWMYIKLYPYLVHASADGRRDMWKTMIAPLFNAVIALMAEENSMDRITNTYGLWRETFKRFMMIPKSTPTDLVDKMIGTHLADIVVTNSTNANLKWDYRKNREEELLGIQKPQSFNFLKGISNDWCSIVRMQYRLCPICIKTPNCNLMNKYHMATVHNIRLAPCKEIWNEIMKFYLDQLKKKERDVKYKLRRDIFIKNWTEVLKKLKEDTETKLQEFLQIRN